MSGKKRPQSDLVSEDPVALRQDKNEGSLPVKEKRSGPFQLAPGEILKSRARLKHQHQLLVYFSLFPFGC